MQTTRTCHTDCTPKCLAVRRASFDNEATLRRYPHAGAFLPNQIIEQDETAIMKLGRENTPILILCLLQVADLISTRMALKVPGVLELNPLVRELGLWQSKLTVLILIVILAYWVKKTKRVRAVWLVCAVYSLIVASNMLLIVSHSGF